MSGDEAPVVVLFRRDLRIADNLALAAAAQGGRPVIAAFILDDSLPAPGGAAFWWLHHSLAALSEALRGLGLRLVLRRGAMAPAALTLARESGAREVVWNRRYHPAEAAADATMKAALREAGLGAESFSGQLLHEPTRLKTGSGGPYRVYGAFRRALLAGPEPRDPLPAPAGPLPAFAGALASEDPSTLVPLPACPDWAAGLRESWQPGEAGAGARLARFLDSALAGYAGARDRPGEPGTSRLSPHLATGEITPVQIAAALRGCAGDVAKFRDELIWREFCAHQLFHFPELPRRNLRESFDAFPWRDDPGGLKAWQRGRTGYPLVDAGMRELWRTGFMHNRVRMVAASFLIKHLTIDWRAGEAWFADTLVDHDAASNAANWQWVAGSGADAAPFFRIFNPVLQGERFDPQGAYVRRWLPELAALPDRWIHRPWEAPEAALRAANLVLGRDYPRPVVDHAAARARALAAFKALG